MKRKYVAFDLEIANEIPDGETDWHAHRPLGISCAGLWRDGASGADLFYASEGAMPKGHCQAFVQSLAGLVDNGYTIVTWNGLSFDFDVLAEESGMHEECRQLALGHVDMMFHFFCIKGFPLGLNTAAKGMRLAGKTEGMDGAQAPALWQAGEYQKVLDYLAQDVKTTLEVARACEEAQRLQWTARSGRLNNAYLPAGWLIVEEALRLPEPDNSWMDAPWPREKFTAWLEEGAI